MIVPGTPGVTGMSPASGSGSNLLSDPQQPSNTSLLMAAGELQKLGRFKGTQQDQMAPKKLTKKLKVI